MVRQSENKYNSELGQWLRDKFPSWEILKHCDRFTGGVPDFSVSFGILTAWLEVKILRRPKDDLLNPNHWCDNKVQLETLIRQRGSYYVYDPFKDRSIIVDAGLVKRCLLHGTKVAEEYIVKGKNWEGIYQHLSLLVGTVEQFIGGTGEHETHTDSRSLRRS